MERHVRLWLMTESLRRSGVVLFGAGWLGLQVARTLRRLGVAIHTFLDNRADTPECAGAPVRRVVPPACLGFDPETPVIVSINKFPESHGLETVLAQARESGWTRVAWHPEWEAALHLSESAAITAVDALWADEKSRRLYRQALAFRASQDATLAPPGDDPDEYFPADVPGCREARRWIHGGACDGDTLAQALALGLDVEEAAFFEPDPANYRMLTAQVRQVGVRATCWPCGLAARLEALRFRAGLGRESRLDSGGDALVQCVDIDSALPMFSPTFVALDIEGAESEALEGMRETIIRSCPRLAISAYHRPDDWWAVPGKIAALVRKHGLSYKFYLRVHGALGVDGLLYAVPSRGSSRSGGCA